MLYFVNIVMDEGKMVVMCIFGNIKKHCNSCPKKKKKRNTVTCGFVIMLHFGLTIKLCHLD
jgi:hypothetical protein